MSYDFDDMARDQGDEVVLRELDPSQWAAPGGTMPMFLCGSASEAERLTRAELPATTLAGGFCSLTVESAAPFVGQQVVIISDGDEEGASHARRVLSSIASKLAVLQLSSVPSHGVSEWFANGGSAFELKRRAAEALEASAAVFPIADLAAWAQIDPTPKRFAMAGMIPEGEVTLFTGPGGTNKSTFGLQLCVCAAAAVPMLRVHVEPSAALYVTAEDDDRENHWRLAKIARATGNTLDALAGKLSVVSLRGRLNNELATFDAEGRLRRAPAFSLLRGTIEVTGSKLVVLDNVGHLFIGNENDRGQVTGFVNLLYQLCRELGVTIVLIAHPNKAGDTYSGSTAWLNAVRSQIVIQRPEDGPDPDARVLTLGKANYARPDQQLEFRWHDFALVLDDDLPNDRRAELDEAIKTSRENGAFLACLAARAAQGEGRQVGPAPGPNYAPAQFEGMPQAKGLKRDRLKVAMDRLFTIGAIETHTYRNTAKGRDVTVIRATSGGVSPNPELPPRTAPEHCSRSTPNSSPDVPPAHTPPLRGDAGAAFWGTAPAPEEARTYPQLPTLNTTPEQPNG